jgi:aryl-alcohol dehydrogenase
MITVTAAIVREQGAGFTLEQVDLDEPQPAEVLVRIEACGVCHTDAKYQGILALPAVFGHEGVGLVEATGAGVTSVNPGDRVILSYPWCGTCPWCRDQEPYKCENIPKLKFGGMRMDGSSTIRQGGVPLTSAFFQQSSFATHAIALERAIVPVTTDKPPEMLAALPCGIQTGAGSIMNTFGVAAGESVIIFGAGTVGLSAVMAAHVAGAYPIFCIDLNESRLELALDLGATHAFNINDGDVPRRVRDVLPRGVQYALDASATVAALEDALECIGQGGRIAVVSFPRGGEKFPFTTKTLFQRVGSLQGTIQGHSVPRKFIPKLIELHEQGCFPYEKLITTYDFSDINRAFSESQSGEVIKPVLIMNQ